MAMCFLFIIVTLAVLVTSKSTPKPDLDQGHRSPVAQTVSGAVIGKIETLPHGKSVYEYLGIPYAEPPVGKFRFTAPQPVKAWSGTKQVTEFGASCPQNPLPIPGMPERESGIFHYLIQLFLRLQTKKKTSSSGQTFKQRTIE